MRDVNTLKGLHGLRTMGSTKKRSIPRVQSSTYLDFYMLDKEKKRLLKEDEKLCMRRDSVRKRLEEIDQDTNNLQGAEDTSKVSGITNLSGDAYTQTNGVKKEFKTMPLNY